MQNLHLFLFLLYIFPGRSNEKVKQLFPKRQVNSLIYSIKNSYSFDDHGICRLTADGERKLYTFVAGFLAIAGGVGVIVTGFVAVARFFIHLFM